MTAVLLLKKFCKATKIKIKVSDCYKVNQLLNKKDIVMNSKTVISCCSSYKINANLNAIIFENYSNGTIIFPLNNIIINKIPSSSYYIHPHAEYYPYIIEVIGNDDFAVLVSTSVAKQLIKEITNC